MTANGLDRRALAVLGAGHMCVDLCQGAVPALLPFLAAERGYSYAALGGLVLASTIGSSIVQPLFGLLSDRFARPWLIPSGLVLAGAGIALAGPAPTYALTAAAVVVSGLGIAMFHPEGAKFAGIASRELRGRGMSLFSVGGNAGFALGPALTTPLVLTFGLAGTLPLVLPALVAAVLSARELPRLRALESGAGRGGTRLVGAEDDWGAFARLNGVVALRTGIYFGLQAFIPAYFVAELTSSEAAGNAALTIMLAAGAAGTLVGGGLVDRWGARAVLIGSLTLLLPLLVALPFVGAVEATVLLGAVGFVAISTFSVTVVMGQAYLPNRRGLASGFTLGMAIGLGGVAATALGFVADAYGVTAVLWTVAALPIPAIVLALTLPSQPAAAPCQGGVRQVSTQEEDMSDRELEALRRHGFGVAYRMLGSVSEAEDVAQEALLRFTRQDDPIDEPAAWITTVATRLSINVLKSARAQRESYVGPWLPEPLLEDPAPGPASHAEIADSLSLALLVLLERLNPVERAAYLLREVFGYEYAQIAEIIERSEVNSRQLVTRARKHLESSRPRFDADEAARDALLERFLAAAEEGDMEALEEMLAKDVVLYADGGGKAFAAPEPIHGATLVARFMAGVAQVRRALGEFETRLVRVNGQPGRVLLRPGVERFGESERLVLQKAMTLMKSGADASEIAAHVVRELAGRSAPVVAGDEAEFRVSDVLTVDVVDGRIQSVRIVRNPDKLAHL